MRIPFLLTFLAILITSGVKTTLAKDKGSQPYVFTNLEMLELKLTTALQPPNNRRYRIYFKDYGSSHSFFKGEDRKKNTLRVTLICSSDYSEDTFNNAETSVTMDFHT